MSQVIVTTSWDDGNIMDLKLAELLYKYGIKGTFYIPKFYLTKSLSNRDLIAINQKFEVGAHTLNHVDLTKLSLSEAKKEIQGSKTYLEDILGHKVYMFCYPKGKYQEGIKKIVQDAGFIAARTCKHGSYNMPYDPYEWQITLHASNGSPLATLDIWRKSGIPVTSLLDWEIRAKRLFDLALKQGGIYHLWGHSWEINDNSDWGKLEKVLSYISKQNNVYYADNTSIFSKHIKT